MRKIPTHGTPGVLERGGVWSTGEDGMIFDRVICGVDGSDESMAAVRQAAAVRQGPLTVLAVLDPWDELLYGPAEVRHERGPRPREVVEAALERAVREVGGQPGEVVPKLVQGRPQLAILDEIDASGATLLVIGSRGQGRTFGLISGSVMTAMVHDSPCSVLVARQATVPSKVPTRAVVGIDGSPESAVALEAAALLRDSLGTEIRLVTAVDGADAESAARIGHGERHTVVPGDAVGALLSEAEDADLLIVGSRGLRGLRALGSVSERLVHQAPCSVLVARTPVEHDAAALHPTTVADVMTSPAIVARDDATVEELMRLMLDNRIGAVPIVGGDGRVVGLVSDSTFAGREVRFS